MAEKPPRAFISYKWESLEVRQWVENFARDLRKNGVDAVLDAWEVEYGDSFIKYMIRNIPQADVFFFIMTPESIASVEAEEGKGGAVSFEVEIATTRKIDGGAFKFIPILLRGEKPATFLRSYRYADFRDPGAYETVITDLIRSVTGQSRRPPILGAGYLEYDYRMYEMMYEGLASVMDQFEPFVGFPFYSFESDHPSSWPPRVDEDRARFAASILSFIYDANNARKIQALFGGESSKVTFVTNRKRDAEEERQATAFQLYANLRLAKRDNEAELAKALGEATHQAFLDLEKSRAAVKQRMPNRYFTLALRQSQGLAIRDVAIDIQIIGEVYDITVNGKRPLDRDALEAMSLGRKMLHIGEIPGAAVSTVRIWHNYIAVAERWDPKPIHFRAEPFQGMLIRSIGAEGLSLRRASDLIPDERPYKECAVNLALEDAESLRGLDQDN